MKNGVLQYGVREKDKETLIVFEWPGRPGPFGWRLADGRLELRGRDDVWIMPTEGLDRSKEWWLTMNWEPFNEKEFRWLPVRWGHIGSVTPDTPTDGVWRGGESLWRDGAVNRPKRDGAPCETELSWLHDKEGILMACPPFSKPYPFRAELDPEGAWITLESEDGEKACLDLADGKGESRMFGVPGWFERALLVLDWQRDQVPPWSTRIAVPEGWDQRRWAAKWARESDLAKER